MCCPTAALLVNYLVRYRYHATIADDQVHPLQARPACFGKAGDPVYVEEGECNAQIRAGEVVKAPCRCVGGRWGHRVRQEISEHRVIDRAQTENPFCASHRTPKR